MTTLNMSTLAAALHIERTNLTKHEIVRGIFLTCLPSMQSFGGELFASYAEFRKQVISSAVAQDEIPMKAATAGLMFNHIRKLVNGLVAEKGLEVNGNVYHSAGLERAPKAVKVKAEPGTVVEGESVDGTFGDAEPASSATEASEQVTPTEQLSEDAWVIINTATNEVVGSGVSRRKAQAQKADGEKVMKRADYVS